MLATRPRRAFQRLFMRSDRLWLRLFGRSVGGALGRAPVLVLHTVGRRTGRPHLVPLCYFPDGDDLIVSGGSGASRRHPAWYWNLQADPEVTVEVNGERRAVTAQLLHGEQRASAWSRIVEATPRAEGYRLRLEREIPVFRLRPRVT